MGVFYEDLDGGLECPMQKKRGRPTNSEKSVKEMAQQMRNVIRDELKKKGMKRKERRVGCLDRHHRMVLNEDISSEDDTR